MAMNKLVDEPQMMKQIMVLIKPMMMVGFRPIVSDVQPHGTAVKLWATEKTALVMPAHLATSSLGTPKLLIISGR